MSECTGWVFSFNLEKGSSRYPFVENEAAFSGSWGIQAYLSMRDVGYCPFRVHLLLITWKNVLLRDEEWTQTNCLINDIRHLTPNTWYIYDHKVSWSAYIHVGMQCEHTCSSASILTPTAVTNVTRCRCIKIPFQIYFTIICAKNILRYTEEVYIYREVHWLEVPLLIKPNKLRDYHWSYIDGLVGLPTSWWSPTCWLHVRTRFAWIILTDYTYYSKSAVFYCV